MKGPNFLQNLKPTKSQDFRGIPKSVFDFYRHKFLVDGDDNLVALEETYSNEVSLLRNLTGEGKKFLPWSRASKAHQTLGGFDLFTPGGSKYITICEGALDAASLSSAFDTKYPVVWVQSSSSKLSSEVISQLSKYKNIVLAFDNDQKGKELLTSIASQLPRVKVRVLSPEPYNDLNEVLKSENGASKLRDMFWSAVPYSPDYLYSANVEFVKVLGEKDVDQIFETEFKGLNSLIRGLTTGNLILFKGMEGIGKTELLRHLAYDMMKNQKLPIATMFLEESSRRTLEGFISYELGTPVHFPDCTVPFEDQVAALKNLNDPEGLLNVYRIHDVQEPSLVVDQCAYLANTHNCKIIFIDPIQQFVSLSDNSDETKILDTIAVKLAKLAVDLDICICMTSHVNDNGQTRSSRMLTKAAHIVINLDRDPQDIDPVRRNQTRLSVIKNRPFSLTGHAGTLRFDISTFRLTELNEEETTIPF